MSSRPSDAANEPLGDELVWEVGEIGNYYGGLNAKVEGGQAFWGIENYDAIGWEPISPALYRALRDHNKEVASDV